jgi:hypothetical protein
MATYTSRETQVVRDAPPNVVGDPAYGGRQRRFRATYRLNDLRINSASGAPAAGLAINDDLLFCDIPPGYRFVAVELVSGVGAGATAFNIGRSPTHVSNTSIATGITIPTANTVVFVTPAAVRAAATLPDGRYFITVGTEAEAASANDLVVDFITVGP